MRTRIQLSKDELSILAGALFHAKFDINESIRDFARDRGIDSFAKLQALEKKVELMAKDKRRQGRTSLNDFYDILKRFTIQ